MNADDAQRELADRLGDRLPPAWRAAYDANPRHRFLPDVVWYDVDRPVDRRSDPAAWLAYAYADEGVVTQVHDGAPSSDHGSPISSSCSEPSVVFAMLERLDAHPGDRILEIGTCTGWNTALLATRFGDGQVVSVEVDAAIAERARYNLSRAGRTALGVTGDGADGYPDGGPYDRVLATCSVQTVPYPWVQQTRPGGVILTPWGPPADNSALLRLIVAEDGTSASGRIVDWARFMRLRGQRAVTPDEPDDFMDRALVSSTGGIDVTDLLSADARLAVALHLPGTRLWTDPQGSELWLLAADSWAVVAADRGTVHQAGSRALWDEAVTGYQWWLDAGRPQRDQWGVTVTAAGQYVWLDHPDNVVRKEISAGSGTVR